LMSLAEQSPSTVAETATAVFDTGELSDVPPEIALQLPDTGELLLGNNIGPNVSYWRVNNRVVAWVLVFVGIAVVLLVNRQISICAAFAGRPHLAFAALALLWWVWLSPSFVGLLLLLSAGSLAIRDWLRTRRSAQTSIPGWSD